MKCFLKVYESVSPVIRRKCLVTMGTQCLKLEAEFKKENLSPRAANPDCFISEVSAVYRTLGELVPETTAIRLGVKAHILSLRSVWSRGKAPPLGEFLSMGIIGTSLNLCFSVPA